jgi:hypothetical protein
MRDNITKVVERQERLDSLQDKTGRCFTILSTRALPPLFGPLVRDGETIDAYVSHRQSCRFRSRLQTQCESGPEGMFELPLCYNILELIKFKEHVVSFECESVYQTHN